MRVPEPSRDLDLAKKTRAAHRRGDLRPHEFHCDITPVLQVARKIDDSHPTAANFLEHLIPIGQRLDDEVRVVGRRKREAIGIAVIEQRVGAFAFHDHAFELGVSRRVTAAQLLEQRVTVFGRGVEDGVEQRLEETPFIVRGKRCPATVRRTTR